MSVLYTRYVDVKLYRVIHPLGEGHFGLVDRGIWNDSNGMIYEVALKYLKPGASQEERVKLLQEAVIMAQFKHPNVLQSYGVVAQPDLVKKIFCTSLIFKGNLLYKPQHEQAHSCNVSVAMAA